MLRALAALTALAFAVPIAGAQVIQVPRRSDIPVAWGSLSAGFLRFDNDIADGDTRSVWRFGSTLQYRGSVEMDVGGAGAVGLAVGYANAPLSYFQPDQANPPPADDPCGFRCDAHAQVWQVMGSFHMGGGLGFHQVIDLSAGTTIYRDFRVDGSSAAIGPDSPDRDIALSVGYGFGYGLNRRVQIMLVQDAAYVMHQRTGLSGGDNSNTQQFTTRLGVRVGLGSKAR